MKGFGRRIGDRANGAATFIAKGTRITGNLAGKGAYVCCGEMDGNCDVEGAVTLADGGHWKGTLKATDVVIAGTVDGDVIASGRVEIAGSARIAGSLSGMSIAVSEGAVIEGEIRVLSGESPKMFEERRGAEASRTPTAA